MSAMAVKKYQPRSEKYWKRNDDGSVSAQIYTAFGVVGVFTFPGDSKHEQFTSLEMYIDPSVYHCRLPRFYSERWLRRLAYKFSAICQRGARKSQGPTP